MQFVALALGQLPERCDLRDAVVNLNAVLAQLWIAMCAHHLLSFLRFVNWTAWSLHQILRVFQLNPLDRRPIMDLLKPKPPNRQPQLTLKLA